MNEKIIEKIIEDKEGAEANVVGLLFKKPEMLENKELTKKDFSSKIWKFYFSLVKTLYEDGKKKIDDITVGLFFKKNAKSKETFEKYGGYKTISKIIKFIQEENFESYYNELVKMNVLLRGYKVGMFSVERYDKYKNMKIEEIYKEQEAVLNDIFLDVTNESELQSFNACNGLLELIEEMNSGKNIGLQFNDAPLLNDLTGGCMLGNITMFGGLSGMGKSTMTSIYYLPTILKENEKVVIMINEEDEKKWQKELLILFINKNREKKNKINKKTLRDGNFSEELLEELKKSARELEEMKERNNIIIIPFQKYKNSLAVKVIKKYANMGVKYFILDTFKADVNTRTNNNDATWLQMQQASVELYDTIKPVSKNVHLWFTFQLGKQSSKQSYYSQDNIGMAKNIIDVASTCIMLRKMLDKEKNINSKNHLVVYKVENGRKIEVSLDEDKRYVILFVVKNRNGIAEDVQIVAECDLSTNSYKEIGYTHVPEDF